MGLFSSKSKSTSTTKTEYTDNSTDINNAASLGMGASDNKILGNAAVYYESGLTDNNLENVLGATRDLIGSTLSANSDSTKMAINAVTDNSTQTNNTLSSVFDKMVGAVQSSAETAITSTGAAYAESDNELRNTIDGLRPIAMYAMFAAIAYFVFRRS